MKVIIYLCFTLLSIFIQFCIMDILERNKSDIPNQEKNNLKDILEKPHALYYKIDGNTSMLNKTPKYSNVSLIDPFLDKYYSTPTPMYDMLFEDNSTTTDATASTEMYTTTVEYANETDFELFPKVSTTTPKPILKPKKLEHKDNCFCDLLYHSCDVNCCCDEECSVAEQQLFSTCQEESWSSQQHNMCSSNISIFSINGLICSSKSNLPEKRNAVSYLKENINVESVKSKMFTWIEQAHSDKVFNFFGKQYMQNEPIWILYENKITSIDLPIPYINNFCTERKPMRFLKDEHYRCLVKLKSLESLKIYRFISTTQVVSVPVDQSETKALNCSTLLCTHWNIVICDQENCQKYNETIHEPECNDDFCKNIALKVEYVFHCNISNITHATVRLHTQDIELKNQHFNQEIKVTFHLGAQNATDVVHFSGNPGYIEELPVIASFDKENHTERILNNNENNLKILRYPDKYQGMCLLSNTTYKVVQFRENIRSKCNYKYNISKNAKNATVMCRTMQSEIHNILDANRRKFISPLGNPSKLSDKDWIEIKQEIPSVGLVFGEYDLDNSTVICMNLATKLSYVFTYADIGNDETTNNKILDAKYYLKPENSVRINSETTSTVLTVDISFLDVTKQPEYEYAGAPHLNIHLPEDFFYPFTQNKGFRLEKYLFILVTVCGFIV